MHTLDAQSKFLEVSRSTDCQTNVYNLIYGYGSKTGLDRYRYAVLRTYGMKELHKFDLKWIRVQGSGPYILSWLRPQGHRHTTEYNIVQLLNLHGKTVSVQICIYIYLHLDTRFLEYLTFNRI